MAKEKKVESERSAKCQEEKYDSMPSESKYEIRNSGRGYASAFDDSDDDLSVASEDGHSSVQKQNIDSTVVVELVESTMGLDIDFKQEEKQDSQYIVEEASDDEE